MELAIQNLMTSLQISREEALQVIEDDKAIDRGEKLFELSPELAEGSKKARRGERKQTEKAKRERKPNEDKQFLIRLLSSAIHNSDNPGFGEELQLDTINVEREFSFTYNGTKYKVVLSCPRT